jgi:general secretion pathway protein E/type IV pilus assembly protein PilB
MSGGAGVDGGVHTFAARDVLARYAPLPEGPDQYPAEFIGANGVIKLREKDDLVTVGVTGKATEKTKNLLRNFHRAEIVFIELEGAELSAWLSGKLGEAGGGEGAARGSGDGSLSLDLPANDAPVINLVNSICIEGIRSGASDIHLEAEPAGVRVRYRIDGALRTVRTIPTGRFPAVSSRIKIMANLNILERRQPQDGRITVTVGEERIDLRVSIVPVTGGESIVLRILGKKAAASSLEELGFEPDHLLLLRSLLRLPHGLILVTGPTGSGKTTTLNALLGSIVSDSVKIITIEDPVEFIVPGVNQIQTNEGIGLSFGTLLRRVLRQDPNVILIGEIRDGPTAEIALRSALTGHLVLSTLHTNDAASVIPRLINMGLEPYLVASVLKGAAAQRLVRKLCPHCKTSRPPDAEERRILRHAGVDAPLLWHRSGCRECGGTGFAGRTVIAELFASGPALEEVIMKAGNSSGITAFLAERGMRSLLQNGLRKAAAGITTMEEVEREVLISEGDG